VRLCSRPQGLVVGQGVLVTATGAQWPRYTKLGVAVWKDIATPVYWQYPGAYSAPMQQTDCRYDELIRSLAASIRVQERTKGGWPTQCSQVCAVPLLR
jgi:hypothetical protein